MSKLVDVLREVIAMAINGESYSDINDRLEELDKCPVKIYREREDIKLPTYAIHNDACMDVYVDSVEVKPGGQIVYHTGLHFALPDDYEMEIRPRSSNTKTTEVMQNAPGTLDAGYRGELLICHRCIKKPRRPTPAYEKGDRIAQILIRRREKIVWDEVKTKDELGSTERGDGGFGSTGR